MQDSLLNEFWLNQRKSGLDSLYLIYALGFLICSCIFSSLWHSGIHVQMEFAMHLSTAVLLLLAESSLELTKIRLWRGSCCASGKLRARTNAMHSKK